MGICASECTENGDGTSRKITQTLVNKLPPGRSFEGGEQR